ncbi:MAG: hypothetical protein JSU66_03720 [Deltaproteobacteria bacterium]|nr:MAG: hypothetical protein JSU66_03720 [Deltaproteobacteria bacterium]
MSASRRTRASLAARGFALAGFLVIAGHAAAGVYAVGSTLEPFALEDQHGEAHRVDGSVDVILFSREMKGGDLLKEALEGVPAGFLAARRAVYVADISGMPSLVARLFALPKLRKRPYPILLDRDGSQTRNLPSEDGAATLIVLDDLRVARVAFLSSAEAVKRALGLSKAEPGGAAAPR